MFKTAGGLISILLLFQASALAQQRVLTDDLGFRFISESPPQRIVSLAPNITEILFFLGLESQTVGVTRFCDFPPEAIEKEKIGGLVDPQLEKILALKPDLIIAFRGNPLRLVQRMRGLDLPVFVLEMGMTVENVFDIIEEIGEVTWTEKKASRLTVSLQTRYHSILASLEHIQFFPKVFLSLHGMGLWTCGQGTFLDDLLHKAKGTNIAGETKREWILFNREELIYKNPDCIIILSKSQKEFLKAKDDFMQNPFFNSIKAVNKKNIYFLDENLVTRLGPRIFEALDQLAHLIHPDLDLNR